jgi:holin-like protein
LKKILTESRIFQIFLLIILWMIGQELSYFTNHFIPANIIALFLLIGLFLINKKTLNFFQLGAKWLLAEMLLFFVPATVAFFDHPEFLSLTGIKIFAIILVNTALVMICSAFVVDYLHSKRGKL